MGGKKIAGLPLYVWAGAAVVGLALGLWLRHRSASTGTTVPTVDYGGTPSAGGTSGPVDLTGLAAALAGGGVAPSSSGYDPTLAAQLLSGANDTITMLAGGGQNAAVAAQENALGLAAHAQDALVALSTAPSVQVNIPSSGGSGSSSTGKTAAATKTAVAKKPAPKAPTKKVAPAPVKYFTFQTQVKPKAGQTIHYTTGKGFYAA